MDSTALANSRFLFSQAVSPTGHTQADHGNIAATPDGWLCTPWSYDTVNRKVACRITRASLDVLGASHLGEVFELATPGTSVYGGGESCEKPWVARLSNTEFVVTWERQATATTDARIEAARIYLEQSDGKWKVDQASSGIGYTIGTAAVTGDADCNCRTIFVEDGYFFVSHGTETSNTGPSSPTSDPHEREYTLRTALVRWINTDTSGPVSVATKAYTAQHWDDTDEAGVGKTISGGYLLSQSYVTRRGDITVAWENRDWNGANFVSTIQFRTLSGLYSATPLTEIASSSTVIASSTAIGQAFRRPQFGSMHPKDYRSQVTVSGGHEVIWVYGDENIATPGNSAAKLGVLSQYAGAGISNTAKTWAANSGLNANLDKLGSSCAFMGRLIQGGMAVADYDTTAGRILSLQHADSGGAHERLWTAVRWPDRPTAVVLPVVGGEMFFLTYEGFNSAGGSSASRRYVDAYFIEG